MKNVRAAEDYLTDRLENGAWIKKGKKLQEEKGNPRTTHIGGKEDNRENDNHF